MRDRSHGDDGCPDAIVEAGHDACAGRAARAAEDREIAAQGPGTACCGTRSAADVRTGGIRRMSACRRGTRAVACAIHRAARTDRRVRRTRRRASRARDPTITGLRSPSRGSSGPEAGNKELEELEEEEESQGIRAPRLPRGRTAACARVTPG